MSGADLRVPFIALNGDPTPEDVSLVVRLARREHDADYLLAVLGLEEF